MADALKGADGRYTLVGREERGWTIGSSMAGRVSVQIGDEGGANYYEGAAQKDALVLLVPLSDPRIFRWNGLELDHTSLAGVGTNGSVSYNAKTANRTSLLMLPIDMLGDAEQFDFADAAVLRDLNGVLAVDPRRIELLRG